MQAAQLAPLGVTEILDVAIKIYWRNAPTLFRLVFLVVAPVQALSVLIFSSALPEVAMLGGGSGLLQQQPLQPTPQQPLFEPDELWAFGAGILVLVTLTIIAGAVSTAACFKAITDAYLEAAPEWKSSLRFATSRLLSVVWVTFLTAFVLLPFLPIAILMTLAVVAGVEGGVLVATIIVLVLAAFAAAVWLYVSVQVSVPALLTEDLRGTKALRRSYNLVTGRWWQTFLIIVLGGLLAGIVSGAISGLLTAVTFTDLGDSLLPSLILNAIGTTIATVLTTPFTAAFVTVLYFDLRVRKEGFDLELLAQRVGVDPPAGGGLMTTPHSRPPATTSGSQPPYWPPPPGWRPGAEDPPQS